MSNAISIHRTAAESVYIDLWELDNQDMELSWAEKDLTNAGFDIYRLPPIHLLSVYEPAEEGGEVRNVYCGFKGYHKFLQVAHDPVRLGVNNLNMMKPQSVADFVVQRIPWNKLYELYYIEAETFEPRKNKEEKEMFKMPKTKVTQKEVYELECNLYGLSEAGCEIKGLEQVEEFGYSPEALPPVMITGSVENDDGIPCFEFWYGFKGYGRKFFSFGLPAEENTDCKALFEEYAPTVANQISWEELLESL